ncbi:MAG TPA: CBS domain-containing protein [Candidatus Polarisedimenticolia bacterium]|nr:CBS domain-containing protein [Candidatus Polarisedimenticolia bacterium]
MTCPDCGHDNIDGMDACGHCGQDLRSFDLPRPKAGLQWTIMETPLRELEPALALSVGPSEPLSRVVALMQTQRQGSVLVVEGGRLLGIFTERDALNRLAGRDVNLETLPVSQVMTRDPMVLRDDDTLAFALHRMAVGNYRHIPIVRDGQPLRFVSVRGVLRYLHEHAR